MNLKCFIYYLITCFSFSIFRVGRLLIDNTNVITNYAVI